MRFLVAKHHLHGCYESRIKIIDNSNFGRDALTFLESVNVPEVTFGQESAGTSQTNFDAEAF